MEDLVNLKKKVARYHEILANTINYRKAWQNGLQDNIYNYLDQLIKETGLTATLEVKSTFENMGGILLSLGQARSGIFEKVNSDVQKHMIKHNGSLLYQQLFNGKIMVLINNPMIEGYGDPRPPITIGIYRPEEIKPPFVLRHLEEFLKEITNWEDFDDDEPSQKIGFNVNLMNPTAEG